MDRPTRKTVKLVSGAASVLVVRAALPAVLTWLVNLGLRKTPGYRGRVRRVNLEFITPRLVVQGITLATLNGGQPEHHFEVASVVVGSRWRDILTTRWIGYIRVEGPQVSLDLTRSRQSSIADKESNAKGPG